MKRMSFKKVTTTRAKKPDQKLMSDIPEENGLVGRMHGIVLGRSEAFTFAVEGVNVRPSSALAGAIPYSPCFVKRPDLSTLRTWGCLAFYFIEKVLRKRSWRIQVNPVCFWVIQTDQLASKYWI
ncbi:Retrovirus-related Pol Polyprotein from transposon TNT 1-94 [Phytophthora megakarya]|uniref:Retrovirus-related Pol Polyprotein from transposon TNT 1-94 n=1 Tax=Phytophthora megakarya TaxID=4795 RepID=A0A225WFW2_9STRA|nr:Retrovirus-related Pol Polyprotein from transposon TNT 1-94 [Phytophthora megakarya]